MFFSKYAKDHNHRMLISHSLLPSVFMILIGIIFSLIILIFSGMAYFIHIVIDTFDWGTNVFYFPKKQVGLKLLISKEEFDNMSKYLSNYKKPESFFDEKYYNSKFCLAIEVLLFVLMFIFLINFAFQFFLIILFYFPFLIFHLQRHFYLKKGEAN
ncbi:MAG: hypothetical protein ACFFFB_04865 [Candidatus Heimdallarchaeota archaeon]